MLAVLLQEGNGKAFSVAASSLLHAHYGSDMCLFILAAVWARDLLLVEAFLRHIVLSQGSNLFPLWLMAGGLGASLVFALTVVSAPLLLDRDTDLATALLVSVRAVGANPGTMAFWATCIMLGTALSMFTAMLGFVIAIPVIGHATWHAYRDTVDAGALPARPR